MFENIRTKSKEEVKEEFVQFALTNIRETQEALDNIKEKMDNGENVNPVKAMQIMVSGAEAVEGVDQWIQNIRGDFEHKELAQLFDKKATELQEKGILHGKKVDKNA